MREDYCTKGTGRAGQPAKCIEVRCEECPNRETFYPKKPKWEDQIDAMLAKKPSVGRGVSMDIDLSPGAVNLVQAYAPNNGIVKADKIVHPNHYARWKMEPIEFIAINDLPWWLANVIKYCMRYDAKDGLQDLYKARSYLDMKIRQLNSDVGSRFWEKPVAEERALNKAEK